MRLKSIISPTLARFLSVIIVGLAIRPINCGIPRNDEAYARCKKSGVIMGDQLATLNMDKLTSMESGDSLRVCLGYPINCISTASCQLLAVIDQIEGEEIIGPRISKPMGPLPISPEGVEEESSGPNVEITIVGELVPNVHWIGIGISEDMEIGNDELFQCRTVLKPEGKLAAKGYFMEIDDNTTEIVPTNMTSKWHGYRISALSSEQPVHWIKCKFGINLQDLQFSKFHVLLTRDIQSPGGTSAPQPFSLVNSKEESMKPAPLKTEFFWYMDNRVINFADEKGPTINETGIEPRVSHPGSTMGLQVQPVLAQSSASHPKFLVILSLFNAILVAVVH